MSVIIARPALFQYGKSLLKSKTKNIDILHKEYYNNDILYVMKRHSGSKIADKFKMTAMIDQNDETKPFKIRMFFNCCVRLHVYFTEGF